MPKAPPIAVHDFRKTFQVGLSRKVSEAAKKIDFEVNLGEIFGFLGPNGAGKTTTIKALLGLVRPSGGEVHIWGESPQGNAWKKRVGYMPEHPTFYDYLTGLEMVTWFGRLSGMSKSEAQARAEQLLDRVGLAHAMKRRLRSYSKGMLQRAGLAQSLVANPDLLILDEPMTGLDPIGRKEIRELLLELRNEGKTIFYSTHILPDVEMTADRVSIINKGVTIRTGRLSEILDETTRGVVVVVDGLSPESAEKLSTDFPTLAAFEGAHRIDLPSHDEASAFLAKATGAGAVLRRFEPHRDDLETIFVRSLEKKNEGGAAA
ncbi:MAG: ABC transporter ATP-binding protein [Deltaproteobacteria bacterium]